MPCAATGCGGSVESTVETNGLSISEVGVGQNAKKGGAPIFSTTHSLTNLRTSERCPARRRRPTKISFRQKLFVSLRGITLNLSATSAEATFKSYGTGRILFIKCCGRPAHYKGITFSSIPFDHGYGHAEDRYCRDKLELSINLAMGRASEASTLLQGIACNMATLAAYAILQRPNQ